jgi:hypothetical protein
VYLVRSQLYAMANKSRHTSELEVELGTAPVATLSIVAKNINVVSILPRNSLCCADNVI